MNDYGITYEAYLQSEHARTYRGTDDDMPDAYDEWVDTLNHSYYAEAFVFDEPIPDMPITFEGDALDWQHSVERERLRQVTEFLFVLP